MTQKEKFEWNEKVVRDEKDDEKDEKDDSEQRTFERGYCA